VTGFPVCHNCQSCRRNDNTDTMTQIVLDVEILSAENSSLSGGHVIDDVTAPWGSTSGRRDTAFQSIEKRFRADLRRRLHELRVQLEESRGTTVREDSAGPRPMPTIAVRPTTGAWRMPRPPRRRCVSYQSVTHAVSSLTMLSPRALSSSVPPGSRRTYGLPDSSSSLSDDPLTSPEVARSRDSMTSSTSDLSAVFDPDLSATAVGGRADVIAEWDTRQTAQRIYNTRVRGEDGEEPAAAVSRRGTSLSHGDRNADASRAKSNTSPAVRPEVERGVGGRRDDANNPALEASQTRSSATSDLRSTATSRSRPSSAVPDVRRHRPEIAASALRKCAVDVMPASSSSQAGTGNSWEERRRSLPEKTTIDNDPHSQPETDDVDIILPPSVKSGQSKLLNHISTV